MLIYTNTVSIASGALVKQLERAKNGNIKDDKDRGKDKLTKRRNLMTHNRILYIYNRHTERKKRKKKHRKRLHRYLTVSRRGTV